MKYGTLLIHTEYVHLNHRKREREAKYKIIQQKRNKKKHIKPKIQNNTNHCFIYITSK